MRCQFGTAAQAGPEARAFGLRRVAEEAAVLALGRAHPADRPAVDPGRRDAGEERAVETRVPGLQCQVAVVGFQVGLVGDHGLDDTQRRQRHWPFSDMSRGGAGPTIPRFCRRSKHNRDTSFMQFSPSIFKAYDIRGVVPATVNEEMAQALGHAFGTIARGEGEPCVAVGRDGRLSGPALSAALVRGLLASGVDVIDIGPATTPMLYFAANTLCASGIQVTGSHNPKDYNGFKMVMKGRAIYGDEIQALRRQMEQGAGTAARPGHVRNVNLLKPYRDRILQDVKLARPLKLVVDSGNGIAGASAPGIFRALGCEVIELFREVDGNFPNHHPDPSKPENLKDLIAAIAKHGADLGLAFDGDGDRLGIVTRGGNNIYPDRQMMLFARDVLSRVPCIP